MSRQTAHSSRAALAIALMALAGPAAAQSRWRSEPPPAPVRALHACAPDGTGEWFSWPFAGGVLFQVRCPGPSPQAAALIEDERFNWYAFYIARDVEAAGARLLAFPVPGIDGTETSLTVLPNTVHRDMTRPGELQADWRLPGRPDGRCAARANWRIAGGRAELMTYADFSACGPEGPARIRVDRRRGTDRVDRLAALFGPAGSDELCFVARRPAARTPHRATHLALSLTRADGGFRLAARWRSPAVPLWTGGTCSAGARIVCTVECDGGGFVLQARAGGRSLTLNLSEPRGSVSMNGCSGGPDRLEAEPGEPAYRLVRVPAAVCQAALRAAGAP